MVDPQVSEAIRLVIALVVGVTVLLCLAVVATLLKFEQDARRLRRDVDRLRGPAKQWQAGPRRDAA